MHMCVMPKMTNATVNRVILPDQYEHQQVKYQRQFLFYPYVKGRMSWKDLRRYWRRVYGFLLPEKAEPCVLVEFYRG